MKEEIVLIGGGGHCKSCIDVIEQNGVYSIAGIVDVPEKVNTTVLGYRVIAADKDLKEVAKKYSNFLITIGHIKNPEKRIILYKKIKNIGGGLPAIVSPLAHVSRHASIGEGTIVMHHALINADAKIGVNCIINSKALVEHDTEIGDHCHIATGAVVNGEACIESETFFGSNSTSRECIRIGRKSIIGFHMRVKTDIPPNTVLK